ncbi:MAG: integrase arm-type DNA-binding domain-containing protein [Burkholderiales bacterium]|nr:integrase arm-type DNA-binding domain-containing protein [Burkholderiales bacterium]
MGKLTNLQICNWIKTGEPITKSDGDGLTFTLSAKGTSSWILRYRTPGAKSQKEITIGRYPDISLAEARKQATTIRIQVQQGIDVARQKQVIKKEIERSWTINKLSNDYLQKAAGRLAPSTIKGRKQQISDYVLPSIGHLLAKEVKAADIVDIVERVSRKSLHVARLVLIAVREIFAHGVARHAIENDPSANIKANSIIGPRPVNRTRIMLTEAELRCMLPALPAIGPQNELMIKILLATAVRIGELVYAEWEHVNFEKRLWTIPAANIKGRSVKAANGEAVKDFVIPLTNPVTDWFTNLKAMAFDSRFVLPIRSRKKTTGDAPMEPVTLNAALNKFCTNILKNKCRRFTPHDLRSTARSHLGALGVELIIAERCLNHSLGGLITVYDQHDYLSERRMALEKWTKFILDCENRCE